MAYVTYPFTYTPRIGGTPDAILIDADIVIADTSLVRLVFEPNKVAQQYIADGGSPSDMALQITTASSQLGESLVNTQLIAGTITMQELAAGLTVTTTGSASTANFEGAVSSGVVASASFSSALVRPALADHWDFTTTITSTVMSNELARQAQSDDRESQSSTIKPANGDPVHLVTMDLKAPYAGVGELECAWGWEVDLAAGKLPYEDFEARTDQYKSKYPAGKVSTAVPTGDPKTGRQQLAVIIPYRSRIDLPEYAQYPAGTLTNLPRVARVSYFGGGSFSGQIPYDLQDDQGSHDGTIDFLDGPPLTYGENDYVRIPGRLIVGSEISVKPGRAKSRFSAS